jgi:hypothetical protein
MGWRTTTRRGPRPCFKRWPRWSVSLVISRLLQTGTSCCMGRTECFTYDTHPLIELYYPGRIFVAKPNLELAPRLSMHPRLPVRQSDKC